MQNEGGSTVKRLLDRIAALNRMLDFITQHGIDADFQIIAKFLNIGVEVGDFHYFITIGSHGEDVNIAPEYPANRRRSVQPFALIPVTRPQRGS